VSTEISRLVRSGPIAEIADGGSLLRPAIVVVGMHRSGTSLLANVLHLLGAEMVDGAPLKSPRNPTGFWERPEIVALHDEILAHLKRPVGALSHVLPFPAGWWRDPELLPFKRRLEDLVKEQLAATTRTWGFKDPRTCRLLPMWSEIFDSLDIEPRFVWALRHPAESGTSMKLKNPDARPMTHAQAELMWLSYNYDVLRYAGRHRPIVVDYDSWFVDPVAVAGDLALRLDLRWEGSDEELRECLHRLIDPEHRHHWAGAGPAQPALPIAGEFHRFLKNALSSDPQAQISGIKAIDLLLQSMAPFADSIDEASKIRPEHERLKAEVVELNKNAEALHRQLAAAQEADRTRTEGLQAQVAVLNRKVAALSKEAAGLRASLAEPEKVQQRAETARAQDSGRASAARHKKGWWLSKFR
jgi:hypothetical protein